MPKGLISGKFNKEIRMKRFRSSFMSCREYSKKSASFLCLKMGTRTLFSTFQTLDDGVSKNIEANHCKFIRGNKKGPPDKSAKFH